MLRAALAGVAMLAAGAAAAQEAKVQLQSRFTGPGRCLGLAEERGLTVPRMGDCGSPDQVWILRHEVGTPWERLVSDARPDQCLDVIADGPNDRLWLGPCGNFGSQFWIPKAVDGDTQGAVWLTNAFTGPQRCLEVVNDAAANDRVRMKECDVWSSQKWVLRPLP